MDRNRVAAYQQEEQLDRSRTALITTLGLACGEILTHLEQHGTTAVRRLVRELSWPAPVVLMAVGALIREGLIRATQHDLEVILEPERTWTIPLPSTRGRAAALAGGPDRGASPEGGAGCRPTPWGV